MSPRALSVNITNPQPTNRLALYTHFQSLTSEAIPSQSISLAHSLKTMGMIALSHSQTAWAVTYNLQQRVRTSQQKIWHTSFLISGIAKMDFLLTLSPTGTNSSYPNFGRPFIK